MTQTENEARGGTGEIAVRKQPMLPLHNGIVSPDKWATFGRIAVTTADTDFVPKGLRGKPEAVMACLLYGDSLGLHPSVSLSDVFVADGKPGVSGALMLSLIRTAGHKITFEWIDGVWPGDTTGEVKRYGARCFGQRIEDGEVVETDEWTYTMVDAKQAGLWPNSNPKAAWMKTPMVMCRWRALAQLVRFLFPDVLRGGSIYIPDEAEEASYSERLRVNGAAVPDEDRDSGGDIDYGDDPEIATWLLTLFAAANEVEPGTWLPAKVRIALRGKSPEEREALAQEVFEWIESHGIAAPERPEKIDDAEFTVIDDPAATSTAAAGFGSGADETKLD